MCTGEGLRHAARGSCLSALRLPAGGLRSRQERVALLSHIPSRWYIPYEANDPFGLPEELEQVKAVLLGRLDDISGERTHGTTAQLGARPVVEALREESAVGLEDGNARNYRRRSADAGAEAGVVDGGTDHVERSGNEYEQQSRSAPFAYLDAIGQPLWKRATHPLLAELYIMVFVWPVVQIGLWQLGGSHPEHGLLDIVVGNICFIAASLAFGLVRDCLHREEPPCVPVVSSDRLDGAGRHEHTLLGRSAPLQCCSSQQATSLVRPNPLAYALRRPRATLEYTIRTINLNPQHVRNRVDHLRQLVAYTAVLAIFVSSYHGVALLRALVPSLAVYLAVQLFRPQEQHIKVVAVGLLGAVVG